MITSRIVAVAAAVALAGGLTAQAQQVSENANRNRKLITAEEIDAAHVNNAYQVIEKLHPEYLQRVNRIQTLGSGQMNRGGSRGGGASSAGEGSDPMQAADQSYIQPEPQRTTAVFVDGNEMGGLEELQQVQSNLIEEIRYLSAADAEAKYGPRFSAGVIELKLKNR
jgi:hypothetical protein